MKLAFFMDALHTLHPQKDTTLAMIQRAEAMGFECVFFTQDDLFCKDGEAFAQVSQIQLYDDLSQTPFANTTCLGEMPLQTFDIILIRKDPPFNLEYLYALNALELALQAGVLVANKPQSLRDVNEKMFILHFPELIAPTLVTANRERLHAFWMLHQEVVLKPLDGMGGQRIFHVGADGRNLTVILDMLTANGANTIMAQRFIPEIHTEGDKRIILIDGTPQPYALARFPAFGEFRGNLAAGGHGKVVPITERDRDICKRIGPTLQQRGLSFVGIDVIGPYLTEVNVTSPTCACQITKESGLDIVGDYLKILIEKRRQT